jgi:hypothetical protein
MFEKRNIREYNKRWYEYHRPRNPEVMLSKKKIVTPRLFRRGEIRFALDRRGIIPQDSCICLSPTPATAKKYNLLRNQISEVLGMSVSNDEVLKYCLAFLNSKFAESQLIAGQRPTPKGFYNVTEKGIRRVPIPPPQERNETQGIIDLVTQLIVSEDCESASKHEEDLESIVNDWLRI